MRWGSVAFLDIKNENEAMRNTTVLCRHKNAKQVREIKCEVQKLISDMSPPKGGFHSAAERLLWTGRTGQSERSQHRGYVSCDCFSTKYSEQANSRDGGWSGGLVRGRQGKERAERAASWSGAFFCGMKMLSKEIVMGTQLRECAMGQ